MNNANVYKVEGIIPFERDNINSASGLKQKNNSVNKKETKEQIKLRKMQEKADEKFDKIRHKMILQAFGISDKVFNEYLDDVENIQHNSKESTFADDLKDKKRTAAGQKKSVSVGDKEIVKDTLKVGLPIVFSTILVDQAAQIGAIMAQISATIPGIGYAASSAIAIAGLVKYLKSRKGNVSDANEKRRDYEKNLTLFISKLKALENEITRDKKLIMRNQQNMSKSEFNKFIEDYITKKSNALGLNNFIEVEPMKDSGSFYEENQVSEWNDSLGDDFVFGG